MNPANSTTVFAALDYYTLIEVSGKDAQSFLQNQLSNDIKDINTERSQLSSYSSAKGMMFANFRVLTNGDSYFLRIPSDVAEPVLKRLRMFVLRDDVQLQPSETLNIFGLAGPDSQLALAEAELPSPKNTDDVITDNDLQIVNCTSPAEENRYELIVPKSKADSIKSALSNYESSSNAYLEKQLLSGEAFISQPTYEQFVAQNLNLELINGVSFKKGCYPGQEYIARTQYRGQVRSRTYLISGNADMPAGTELCIPGKEDGDAIGTILNSTNNGDTTIALAVIRNKQVEKQEFALKNSPETQLKTIELPYSLTPESE